MKVQIRKIVFYYPNPMEFEEEFIPELEVVGIHFDKEENALEFKDLTKFPLFFSLWMQAERIHTLDDLRAVLASTAKDIAQKEDSS